MSLTMAQGIKRLGMPIAALFGLVLIGLVGTSWFLNRDALQSAVEAQIRAVTGLELVVNGPIDVSVFPGSYVSFHNVGLKGADTIDPALQVDVLTANLRCCRCCCGGSRLPTSRCCARISMWSAMLPARATGHRSSRPSPRR